MNCEEETMIRILGAAMVLLLAPFCAAAQTPAPDDHEQEIRDMRARIEKLEKLVAELQKENESKNSVTAAQTASQPVQAPAEPSSQSAEPSVQVMTADHSGDHQLGATNEAERRFPALHFRGFGDVDF